MVTFVETGEVAIGLPNEKKGRFNGDLISYLSLGMGLDLWLVGSPCYQDPAVAPLFFLMIVRKIVI